MQQQIMRVHYAEHDFKNALFKAIGFTLNL